MPRRADHPGSIDKRPSGKWRVRLSVNGERHSKTLPEGTTREEAEEYASNWHRELSRKARRAEMGLPVGETVSGLLERFETDEMPGLTEGTQRSYKDSLKPIKAYFVEELGDPKLEEIRPGHVRGFMTWRRTHGPSGEERDTKLSGRTIEKDRSILHRMFEFAAQLELVPGNPVARTEPPNYDSRDPVILSNEQYEGLIEEAEKLDPMLGAYVTFLGETGARAKSEALWVRWTDVDLDEGFVWLASDRKHRTKSGEGRWVPLSGRLRGRIRDHAADYRLRTYGGERSPWLFHHTRNLPTTTPGERRKDYREAFEKACEDASLPEGFVRHDLRHRRVTTWLAEGKSPALVREAMGHSTMEVTMKYTHLAREHLRALVEDDTPTEKPFVS